jgi:type IV secretion system protein VirB9
MNAMKTLLLALSLMVAPAAGQAADSPRPGVVDPRIQTIEYDPNQVVVLRGTLGYQFMLEFAPDERIETVSIGDSLGWQVTPNRNANVLFIKPIDARAATNLTVLSDQRRYAFELTVAPRTSRAPVLYVARMVYPQPALAQAVETQIEVAEALPTPANTAYAVAGAAESQPARVFDDGRQTFFEWRPDSPVPAIFAVGGDGAENLVNYAVRGSYTVVEQLAPRFVLRNGASVATVLNQGYAGPQSGDRR